MQIRGKKFIDYLFKTHFNFNTNCLFEILENKLESNIYIDEISHKNDSEQENIVVISHGGMISILINFLIKYFGSLKKISIRPENTSVFLYSIEQVEVIENKNILNKIILENILFNEFTHINNLV